MTKNFWFSYDKVLIDKIVQALPSKNDDSLDQWKQLSDDIIIEIFDQTLINPIMIGISNDTDVKHYCNNKHLGEIKC